MSTGIEQVIYFGYPKEFVDIKMCGDRVRKTALLAMSGELEFVVETVRTLCLIPGIAEVSPSLLYSNRKMIGFLPTAFTFGGGIEMCPHKYIVSLLDEFIKKRAASLVKCGHFGSVFQEFAKKVTAATSHKDILNLCDTIYPKPPSATPERELPSDEELANRLAEIPPKGTGRMLQIIEDSGCPIALTTDIGFNTADGEALIDMSSISPAGKRALDSFTTSYTIDGEEEEDYFSSSSANFDNEKRQRADDGVDDIEDVTNLTVANLRNMSNAAYDKLDTILKGIAANAVALQSHAGQLAKLRAEVHSLETLMQEKEAARIVGKANISKMLDDTSVSRDDMMIVVDQLAEDAKSIQTCKASHYLLCSNIESLSSVRFDEKRDELLFQREQVLKTIQDCAREAAQLSL